MNRPPFRVELYTSTETRTGRRVKITEPMRLGQLPPRKVNLWRWRKVARNGKIIAVSGEGYYNRPDCIHGLLLGLPGYHLVGDHLMSQYVLPDHPVYKIEVRVIETAETLR